MNKNTVDPLIPLPKQIHRPLKRAKEEKKYVATGQGSLNKRAVILNFTRHVLPVDLLDILSIKYEYKVTYNPHEPFTFNFSDERSQIEQIRDWVYAYLSVKRKNIGFPLDKQGDIFIILPDRDSKLSVYILTALIGIWNRDYTIVWSIGDRDENIFKVDQMIAISSLKKEWKSMNHELTEISRRREEEIMTAYDHMLSNFYELREDQTTVNKEKEEELLKAKIEEFKNSLNEEQQEMLAIGLTRRAYHADKKKLNNTVVTITDNSSNIRQPDTN